MQEFSKKITDKRRNKTYWMDVTASGQHKSIGKIGQLKQGGDFFDPGR